MKLVRALAGIAVVAGVGAHSARAEPEVEHGNAVYVEGLGKGGLWGVGIDHYFHPRWRVGLVGGGGSFEDQRYLTLTPYVALDIVRGGHNAWYVDGGPQLARAWNMSPVPEWSGSSSTGIGGTVSTGYEFRSRLLVRVFFLAAFGKGGLLPWVGVDVGVTF